jgi:ribosome-associated protein
MGRELEKHLIARGLSGNFKPDFESNWIVLDYLDVIVHIFTEETRGFYQLEKLWADASVVPF